MKASRHLCAASGGSTSFPGRPWNEVQSKLTTLDASKAASATEALVTRSFTNGKIRCPVSVWVRERGNTPLVRMATPGTPVCSALTVMV